MSRHIQRDALAVNIDRSERALWNLSLILREIAVNDQQIKEEATQSGPCEDAVTVHGILKREGLLNKPNHNT